MTPNNIFLHDVYFTKPGTPIVAIFKSGREEHFTTNIYNLLITDPDVVTIYNNLTGEIMFSR